MYIPADAAGSVPSAVMLTDFEQQQFQYLFSVASVEAWSPDFFPA